MPLPILGEVIDIGKMVLRSVLPDNMSEEQKKDAELKWEKQMQDKEGDFNNFVLKHTGEAKDMPRSVQVIRGLVRPSITIVTVVGFFWFSWWLFNNITTITDEQQLAIIREIQVTLKLMLLVVLVFWFGDKVITRTGFLDFLVKFKNGKNS